jgi:hypothetical protein
MPREPTHWIQATRRGCLPLLGRTSSPPGGAGSGHDALIFEAGDHVGIDTVAKVFQPTRVKELRADGQHNGADVAFLVCSVSSRLMAPAGQALTRASGSAHFSLSMEKAWGVAWG